jgi:hypothetical protein
LSSSKTCRCLFAVAVAVASLMFLANVALQAAATAAETEVWKLNLPLQLLFSGAGYLGTLE